MAEPGPKKKPRIRKAAPTMREKVEAQQIKADKPKKKRLSKVGAQAGRPFKAAAARRPKVRLPRNKFTGFLGKIFRPIGRVLNKLVPRYFVHAWREVRLVTWPSRRETWRLTLAVFIFALVFGAAAFAVDMILDKLFKAFVLK